MRNIKSSLCWNRANVSLRPHTELDRIVQAYLNDPQIRREDALRSHLRQAQTTSVRARQRRKVSLARITLLERPD